MLLWCGYANVCASRAHFIYTLESRDSPSRPWPGGAWSCCESGGQGGGRAAGRDVAGDCAGAPSPSAWRTSRPGDGGGGDRWPAAVARSAGAVGAGCWPGCSMMRASSRSRRQRAGPAGASPCGRWPRRRRCCCCSLRPRSRSRRSVYPRPASRRAPAIGSRGWCEVRLCLALIGCFFFLWNWKHMR